MILTPDLVLAYCDANPGIFAAYLGFVGLCIGSFLNVVAYRLPLIAAGAKTITGKRVSLSHPPSRCPTCFTAIKPWHNIPVAGWALVGGKCSGCSTPVSLQYPLVELLTGAVTALVAWAIGPVWSLGPALAVVWFAIPIALIGADDQPVPDSLAWTLLAAVTANVALTEPTTTGAHLMLAGPAYLGARWLSTLRCRAGQPLDIHPALAAGAAMAPFPSMPAAALVCVCGAAMYGLGLIPQHRLSAAAAISATALVITPPLLTAMS